MLSAAMVRRDLVQSKLTIVDIQLYAQENVRNKGLVQKEALVPETASSRQFQPRPSTGSSCGELAMSALAPSMRIFLLVRWASLINWTASTQY